MATKRIRSDSVSSKVKAMANAAKADLQPPDFLNMRGESMKYWRGIIRARARDEWSEVDLVVAAQLADCQACIEVESEELAHEGSVIVNDKGTRVANPRANILEALARREMALMRTLRMGGRIAGDARNELGARKLEQQSRKVKEELEDDLLA